MCNWVRQSYPRARRRHENNLEYCRRRFSVVRGYLVSTGHQRLAGQLHDRPDSMGGVRRNRGRSGDLVVASGQPETKKRASTLIECRSPDQLGTPFTPLTRFGRRARSACQPHRNLNPKLEPAAAIGQPPTQKRDWNGCSECPPHRQSEVGAETQNDKRQPEYLALHWPQVYRHIFPLAVLSVD